MINLSPGLQKSLANKQLLKLDQYELLQISGEDALEFLQNQFTNDLKKLPADQTSLSSWCSIKGRVLYSFRIWFEADQYFIIIPKQQTESFLKKLRMYVLRSDVTIEQVSEKSIYGLSGENLDKSLSQLPKDDHTYFKHDENTIIKIPSEVDRYMLVSGAPSLNLDSIPTTDDPKHWDLLDILAGIPEILAESADQYLPQMLNMEQLGGLSFQKGCYPGQEIVARVRYRGELKKQLYIATLKTHESIEISTGASLTNDIGNTIGNILKAVNFEDNNWALLAIINIKETQSSKIKLQDAKTYTLELCNS